MLELIRRSFIGRALLMNIHNISMAQRKTRLGPYFSKISFIINSEQMSHSL